VNALIEAFRWLLIASAALFALGWVVYAGRLSQMLILVFLGRIDLRSAVHDPKLQLLKRILTRVWFGAVVVALVLVALAFIQASPHLW
jgi:hypothetical protein